MILEFGRKQHECLHRSWRKTNDGFEEYWVCNDCGASNETPTAAKTEPTPLPKYQENEP